MFVVTAKVPRKKLLAGAVTLLCCCLAVGAALLTRLAQPAAAALAEVDGLREEDGRVAYLAQLGWEVEGSPVVDELLIPRVFDESYDDYLALQTVQGFDLSRWSGKTIKRYTYTLTNWPEAGVEMQAALLVRRGVLIGGHLQSADGSIVLPLTGTA